MFVFGVAGKSYAYNHIVNALRETWGNDERLRSHDSALSQQLQSGHLAGGVHWSAEDNEWTEADYDCEESLDPWSSEWYDTEGYDDEYFPEETDWTENYYENYDNNDNTFSEHSPALLDQPVETQEEDTSKLEIVQEAVAAANAAADMSRRTWTQARQLMKDVHRLLSCLKGQFDGCRSRQRNVTWQEGTFPHRTGKAQRKKQGKEQRETSRTMSFVPRTTLGS